MTGRVPVVVIGAGPTGIAALLEARRLGLRAIALEAGPTPLASVAGYLEGLVFLSPAWNYEVGGLPLDCRDGGELTREEVLHYYARVIRYGRLEVRCRTRCVGLVPAGDHVEVHVQTTDGPSTIDAGDVIVAAWYERRPPSPALASRRAVEVVSSLPNAISAAGRRVVIVGGGMSALEHATMLMMSGHQLTLVSRGSLPKFFTADGFTSLVTATSSTLVAGAEDLAVCDGGMSWRVGGVVHEVAADLVIACVGARVSPTIGQLLVEAGVIDPALRARLETAPTKEQLDRGGASRAEAFERALRERPDLWRQLFDGVDRIRLAGGALHTGGADAGVLASIQTAVLAIRAIAGQPPPPEFEPPLPAAIGKWCLAVDPTRLPAWDVVAALRPIAVRSFTRTTPRIFVETTSGEIRVRETATDAAPLLPEAAELVRVCDGTVSVAELAEAISADSAADRRMLVQVLCNLWRRNVLMWLPPTET